MFCSHCIRFRYAKRRGRKSERGRKRERERGGGAGRQADRQTDRQTDGQTYRQTETESGQLRLEHFRTHLTASLCYTAYISIHTRLTRLNRESWRLGRGGG